MIVGEKVEHPPFFWTNFVSENSTDYAFIRLIRLQVVSRELEAGLQLTWSSYVLVATVLTIPI